MKGGDAPSDLLERSFDDGAGAYQRREAVLGYATHDHKVNAHRLVAPPGRPRPQVDAGAVQPIRPDLTVTDLLSRFCELTGR